MCPCPLHEFIQGRRGTPLVMLNLGARWKWSLYPLEEVPILTVEEVIWTPGPLWTGVKKRKCLAPTLKIEVWSWLCHPP